MLVSCALLAHTNESRCSDSRLRCAKTNDIRLGSFFSLLAAFFGLARLARFIFPEVPAEFGGAAGVIEVISVGFVALKSCVAASMRRAESCGS